MNRVDDPLRLVAVLEPAMLEQLAEDGYARSRAADMARVTQEGFARPRPARPRAAAVRRLRPYLLTGAVAAARRQARAGARPRPPPQAEPRARTASCWPAP